MTPGHFACFACRKAFKLAAHGIWDPSGKRWLHRPSPTCPQCRTPMTSVGRSFRAPRRADAEGWKKAELLHRSGVTFVGRHDLDTRELLPTKSKDVPAFVEAIRPKSRGERVLDRAKGRVGGPPPTLRFSWGHAPWAKATSRRITLGDRESDQVRLEWTRGAWAELAWKRGSELYLHRTNLPKHVEVNGAVPKRLPCRLHPGDVICVGQARVVVDW